MAPIKTPLLDDDFWLVAAERLLVFVVVVVWVVMGAVIKVTLVGMVTNDRAVDEVAAAVSDVAAVVEGVVFVGVIVVSVETVDSVVVVIVDVDVDVDVGFVGGAVNNCMVVVVTAADKLRP